MYEQKVAIDVVKESFGDDVAKVYEFLVLRGKSSLKIIVQSVEGLKLKRIKECLIILIQHNLVSYEEFLIQLTKDERAKLEPNDPLPTDSIYEANLKNAIHRIRFTKFIHFIKASRGDDYSIVIEELIENGRLTMDQIINQSCAFYNSQYPERFENDLSKKFEEIFTHLIMDQFIMRAPKPKPQSDTEVTTALNKEVKNNSKNNQKQKEIDPFSLPAAFSSTGPLTDVNIIPNPAISISVETASRGSTPGSSSPTTPSKPGNHAKKTSAKKAAALLAEKNAAAAAATTTTTTTGKKRKNQESTTPEDSFPDVLMLAEGGSVDINNSEFQPTQKKRNGLEYTISSHEDDQQKLINDEKKVLWMVNYEQFITEFKLKACYDYVVEKNNVQSGQLFMAMIKLCKKSIRSNSDTLTSCVYGENILGQYNEHLEENTRMDKLQFEKYLTLMQASRPSIVTKMQTKSKQSTSTDLGAYQVNIGNIIGVVKQKLVESIIKQRFGDNGLRVFKLLLIKNLLEPKQIADMAMIPIKECKTLLFNMMQKSIIRLQEVPRSSDHFANRTFYLFFVDMNTIIRNSIDDIFKSIHNTRQRLIYELAPHKDILSKMESLDEETMNPDQSKIVKKVTRVNEILTTVILNLDNDLLQLYSF
ncbi:hypothetical protein CYY_005620 [Polysphondylium violaceum]|uniref:DNA-directed RNA polymerase III subunit RPC3 n=1 Tax=Polysphondylium violaceum TaxID=133409 RepID=A0A8J4UYL3_9MYCE|nr:hypothetical protein CYY_005620 [Polysphondylium violaceum]